MSTQTKTPSPEASGREGESSREDSSRRLSGDDLARKVFREGGLLDQLHQRRQSMRCPYCGDPAPGAPSTDDIDQVVTCRSCGVETTLAVWDNTAVIVDLVREVGGPGEYAIDWQDGICLMVVYAPVDRSTALHVATVNPRTSTARLTAESFETAHHELTAKLVRSELCVRTRDGDVVEVHR